MNQPEHDSWNARDGVPTLMPNAQLPGTAGPGVQIGNFELQTLLGRGGMGEVWKAWDQKAERPVVIKLVPPELQRADEEMGRVRDTFRRVHALQHQHICPLYLLDEDLRLGWYLVMKYIDGQTLSSYRATYAARHGSFLVEQVLKVLSPVAEALDYAHRHKVIHRDIKPQNIMVVGNADDVQVVDFGLAAEIRTTVSRYSQQQMDTSGTRPYMAPEQWRGRGQDARTDQYGLAVVAYELLSGELPFESPDFDILRACVLSDPPEALDDQSPAVNRALLLGLAKRREERFDTCGDFVTALAGCPVGEPQVPKSLNSGGKGSISALPSDLGSGECAQCRTVNEPHRKFCRECAAPLRVQCLKCAVEIPVWEKVCPECGAIQATALAERQQELETLQNEAETLLGFYRFDQAVKCAKQIAAESDRRLQPFKDWAEAFLPQIAEEKRLQEEKARTLFVEAQNHRKTFDYTSAIDTLGRIPKPLITSEMSSFQRRLTDEKEESERLIAEIRQRVKTRQLDDLLPLVTRAHELRGDRSDLQLLKEQLDEREQRLVEQRDQRFAEAKQLLKQGKAKEALVVTQSVNAARLRGPDREFQQQLEIIAKKETALAEILKRCKADGVIDPDEIVLLLTATSEYRTLNPNNAKVNELQDQCQKRFEDLAADGLSRISPKLLAKFPVDLLVRLRVDAILQLPPVRNSIDMPLRLIPAGEFVMGASANDNEKPEHRVRITQPFYLGVYPVTQAEYQRVMGKNPGKFGGNDRRPVEMVSWEDAQEFCRRLSKQEGTAYRLPTEAEWEYACRAGSVGRWCFGDDESLLEQYAWYSKNSNSSTQPVGQKKPNGWGLYDMHGNVWEWCADYWDANYYKQFSDKVAADPRGPSGGSYRVFRGGSWRNGASDCRSAYRLWIDPGLRRDFLGFRLARSVS
jgi:formylglycine-generating enzyme required for sulfatase activity/serine/threonine protein kinase